MGVIKKTVMKPIEYDIVFDLEESLFESGNSMEEEAETLASFVHLRKGTIEFSKDSFSLVGECENGKKISIEQEGEFHMYGGPYDPRMEVGTVIYGKKDITKKINKYFTEQFGDPMLTNSKRHDLARIDLWCHLLK